MPARAKPKTKKRNASPEREAEPSVFFKAQPKSAGYGLAPQQARAYASGGGNVGVNQRWDAATTTRLNEAHWSIATGASMNVDLSYYLSTLRKRCEHEASTSGPVKSTIMTHQMDVVGRRGPTLQILSDSTAYNDAAEWVWRQWWKMPDVRGKLSGGALLMQWVYSHWTTGAHLCQIVNDPTAPKREITVRVNPIHVGRLVTPYEKYMDGNVVMGIEMNGFGRPEAYWIRNWQPKDILEGEQNAYTRVPARDIIHRFWENEVGQVVGLPILAPVLQSVADVVDAHNQVLDAFRAAADNAQYMGTTSPDVDVIAQPETTIDIERRTLRYLPPGYQVMSASCEMPPIGYKEFKRENLSELGHQVCMPGLIQFHDAGDTSFSGANHDARVYWRCVDTFEEWFQQDLERFAEAVFREAEMLRLTPARPKRIEYEWTWDPQPSSEPDRAARAAAQRLASGTTSMRYECKLLGNDNVEKTIREQEDEKALREKAQIEARKKYGLKPLPDPNEQDAQPGADGKPVPKPAAKPKPKEGKANA